MIWRSTMPGTSDEDSGSRNILEAEPSTMSAKPSSMSAPPSPFSMPAPPPRNVCVFGSACTSQEGGKRPGLTLCGYCKNLDCHTLYKLADHVSNFIETRAVVDAYFEELAVQFREGDGSDFSWPCAIKDPTYKYLEWRTSFNPHDHAPCRKVQYQGQLCKRCYEKATQQRCWWLTTQFDGRRYQFPCVFEDPQQNRLQDYWWRRGPGYDMEWEKDPTRHPPCQRREKRGQLCQRCFNRMNEMRDFKKYFDPNDGLLHSRYRV